MSSTYITCSLSSNFLPAGCSVRIWDMDDYPAQDAFEGVNLAKVVGKSAQNNWETIKQFLPSVGVDYYDTFLAEKGDVIIVFTIPQDKMNTTYKVFIID